MLRPTILMIAALLSCVPAAAQEEEPKGYVCQFASGSSQAYTKGRYRVRPAKPLAMEVRGIDLPRQQAELVAGGGTNTLRIVRALGAIHFLEAVTEGYLNITTVYAKDQKRGVHPAVHSRHFGLFGEPLIAQYTGTCTAR